MTIDDPRVKKALQWIKKNYTVDNNPGMENGKMGLYYYWHTMAKTLAILKLEEIEDSSGLKHKWRQDLGWKIIEAQSKDGSWSNTEGRWDENIKGLATAYAVIALDYCQKK